MAAGGPNTVRHTLQKRFGQCAFSYTGFANHKDDLA
jgi:hypothetical protein